jgi:predicted transcriptional regulator
MSDPGQPNIGRAEMDILHYVTEHHPVSVREVADHISETKGHVRTTVLNIMERLRKKGFLRRKKDDGVFKYSPTQTRPTLLRGLIKDFVDRTLGGSVSPFVAYLVEERRLDEREIAELKRIIRDMEGQK